MDRKTRLPQMIGWLMMATALLAGCRPDQPGRSADVDSTPRVFAVSYALYYLTEQITGDLVQIEMPDFGSADPRDWQPDHPTIRRLQQADLIVTNGGGAQIADWMMAVSVSPSKVCESIEGIRLEDFIVVDDAPVHTHGPEGAHSHSGLVATTWLDPSIAQDQSEIILDHLCRTFPDHADAFRDNHAELAEQLDQLAGEFAKFAGSSDNETNTPNRAVLSSEPSFKYLFRALNIRDKHFFWSQETSPITEELWKEFDSQRDPQVKIMVWPNLVQVPESVASKLDQRNIETLTLDLLIAPPASGDYVSVMRQNAQQLQSHLSR